MCVVVVMVHQESGVTPYGVVLPDPGAPWMHSCSLFLVALTNTRVSFLVFGIVIIKRIAKSFHKSIHFDEVWKQQYQATCKQDRIDNITRLYDCLRVPCYSHSFHSFLKCAKKKLETQNKNARTDHYCHVTNGWFRHKQSSRVMKKFPSILFFFPSSGICPCDLTGLSFFSKKSNVNDHHHL